MKGKRKPPTDKEQAFFGALGQRITALREEKKLTLVALATRAGIAPRRLAYLEAGLDVASFPMEAMTAIAAALGVKTFDLFNVEHATHEVAGLLEDLRGESAKKIRAARVALEAKSPQKRLTIAGGSGSAR